MRFVAFDIESTDGLFYEGNLCEFGYVFADNNFDIYEQNNILVKPINHVAKINNRIKLAYSIYEYNHSPTFYESYGKIKSVLCASDTVIVGHAIHNDIVCINSACKVNDLPCFDFKFVDTQLLYSIYKGDKKQMSLDKIAGEINEDFMPHRADEDARMSLETLKYICNSLEMSFENLLLEYQIVIGENKNGEIVNFSSPLCASTAPSLNSKSSKKRLLGMFVKNIKSSSKTHNKDHCFYKKKISIDSEIEMEDITRTRKAIQKLTDIGGKYNKNISSCDILVSDNISKTDNLKCEIMSSQMFFALIGELPNIYFDDIKLLKDYMKERIKQRNANKFYTKEKLKK